MEESVEFNAAVLDQVSVVIDRYHPDKVTFVAKSRGALFLAAMDKATVSFEVEAIWVTSPLVDLPYVGQGIVDKAWRSLLVAGSADPYHEPTSHAEICAAIGAAELVISNGNHGLVVEGDVLATVDGYRQLAETALSYVRR
ncbi:MAG: hypothetical protein ACRDTT_28480, partial [Pseudonocardiaceae bacterium]